MDTKMVSIRVHLGYLCNQCPFVSIYVSVGTPAISSTNPSAPSRPTLPSPDISAHFCDGRSRQTRIRNFYLIPCLNIYLFNFTNRTSAHIP
jgi:hypothetical protein